ncbi:MAG: hypothetical protein ACI4R8_04870 [Candidatus Caccovivens sp.]
MISLNKKGTGMILFYVFEAFALLLALVGLIIAIIQSVRYSSFMYFVQSWLSTLGTAFVIFGIGKIIDLLYYSNVKTEQKTEPKEENKD